MNTHFIAIDLVKVYKTTQKKKSELITVLAWGDEVGVIETKESYIKISLKDFVEKPDGSILQTMKEGFILKASNNKPRLSNVLKPLDEKNVLQISFVDVQQGDGCVVESPKGKVVLIDGGENQMFARYLAGRYPGSTTADPKIIDCIVISHGDADHFEGLPLILESETNATARKRLFINPHRVYHNGIIKRPAKKLDGIKRKDLELFGKTLKLGDQVFLTDLQDNLLDVADEELNAPFKKWKNTLAEYDNFYDSDIVIKRLDNSITNAFDFLAEENITVDVLGPIISDVSGKPGLKFLRSPSKSVAQDDNEMGSTGSYSASHTINGHSIIMRLKYGNVSFMFAGDLNEEAEDILVAASAETSIQSEILKVPHHGSADFSNKFFDAVKPLVSVVSSGDESEMKEYIHPRASLMGALGKHSRIDRPLIFVTELVAFFKREGWSTVTSKKKAGKPANEYYGFSRAAFGIVHVRTDGKKIFVFTHSGQKGLKEAYAFLIEDEGDVPVRIDVVSI